MDFPLVDLVDHDRSRIWLRQHFHPDGLQCPRCGVGWREAYRFRRTKSSQLQVWRCKECAQTYTLYSGTVFEGRHLPPAKVVLLLRGTCQGKSTAQMARELDLTRTTVHNIRQQLQANAALLQPESSVPDDQTETDEMFQNAGKKESPIGTRPILRAGEPTRPGDTGRMKTTVSQPEALSVGRVGRSACECSAAPTGNACARMSTGTPSRRQLSTPADVYTDGWKGYSQVERDRLAVCHGDGEWARDEDGDGIREVHVNTIEGPQATLRNFLRPFRGVHKKHLASYVAICEFTINLKRVTPAFISALVRVHDF